MSINIDRITQLSQSVDLEEVVEGHSAYGVWKITKEVFGKLGLEFTATSQMFYNYAKNGRINGVKDSKGRFTDEEVEAFIAILVAKANR